MRPEDSGIDPSRRHLGYHWTCLDCGGILPTIDCPVCGRFDRTDFCIEAECPACAAERALARSA
jgi:hypothetical protein